MTKFAVSFALCLVLIVAVSADYRPYAHHPRLRRSISDVPKVETEKTTKPVGDDLKTDSTFWYHYRSPGFAPHYSYPDSYYYNYWWY